MVQQAPLGSEVRDGVRAKAWLPLASMLSGANHRGELHAWAERTGHLPGEHSKPSTVPERKRASRDLGTNLERRELEKMGSDSSLAG